MNAITKQIGGRCPAERFWRYVPKSALVATFILVFGSAAFAQQGITVPKGDHLVMIDGKLTPGEWDDAAQFSLGDKAHLYVKQSRGYVWMAVECLAGDDFTVDLYLQPADGLLYDLHSSAKIGERKLHGASWSDQWTWWNNDRWVANWSRVDSFEKRRFLPQKVREYQISRARFTGKTWRVMFELMLPAEPKWQTFAFPEDAKSTTTEHWIVLQFR
jgi:hypothetical protein